MTDSRIKPGEVRNPKGIGGKPREATPGELVQIMRLALEGKGRVEIAKTVGIRRGTLRLMERRDPRVARALQPKTAFEEADYQKIEDGYAEGRRETTIYRACGVFNRRAWQKMLEADERAREAKEAGEDRLQEYIDRSMLRAAGKGSVGAVVVHEKRHGRWVETPQPSLNFDLRKDFTKLTDEQLREIAGLPPLPPEESMPAAHASPASPPTALALPVRAQPGPSPVVQPPVTIEGRVVARRPAVRNPTLKWQRAEVRRREEMRVLAAGGAYTKSMLPED